MEPTKQGPTLTLYVRSEHGLSGPQWQGVTSTGVRLGSMVVPGILLRSGSPGSTGGSASEDTSLPYDQAQCVRLVLDLADRRNFRVQVVDVSDPRVSREAVERAIGTGGVYPLLVRPDGAWLEGSEYFTPSRVRKFLA